jgi:hypothetical protein
LAARFAAMFEPMLPRPTKPTGAVDRPRFRPAQAANVRLRNKAAISIVPADNGRVPNN